jgi:hypothetical protein
VCKNCLWLCGLAPPFLGYKSPVDFQTLYQVIQGQGQHRYRLKYKAIRPVKSAIRIDGFSDNPKNELQLSNDLFFNNDEKDLGLIDLFNQYQFTALNK